MTINTDIVYSICKLPSYQDQKRGIAFGACITDGHSREEVIKKATEYFEQEIIEDGQTCDIEEDVILFISDDSGEEIIETIEPITLRIIVDRDDYDGGRFDYLAGIGAIKTF